MVGKLLVYAIWYNYSVQTVSKLGHVSTMHFYHIFFYLAKRSPGSRLIWRATVAGQIIVGKLA